jgi:hypothetical protein
VLLTFFDRATTTATITNAAMPADPLTYDLPQHCKITSILMIITAFESLGSTRLNCGIFVRSKWL